MPEYFKRALSSAWIAWGFAAIVLIGFGLMETGVIHLHSGHDGATFDYVAAREHLADADKSQPLHMRLEAQYNGPLQDTTIQRWRDPVDGTICYIYLPIAVAHSAGPEGLVQYGAANIGSMSCYAPRH